MGVELKNDSEEAGVSGTKRWGRKDQPCVAGGGHFTKGLGGSFGAFDFCLEGSGRRRSLKGFK